MSSSRHSILLISIVTAFLIITGRFFYWQVINSQSLKKQAILQTQKLEKIDPQKGTIYSSDLFPLALNQEIFQLSLYKPNFQQDITDILKTVDSISPNFSSDNGKLLDQFKQDDHQKWLTLPTSFTATQSQALKVPGISFSSISKRFYPENQLALPIINSLEKFYKKQLSGKTGFVWTSQDAMGQSIFSQKNWFTQALDGQNLNTFINRSIQYQIEKKLSEGINKYQADSGSIIVSVPQTGAIIAISSLSASPSASQNIPAISNLFEPGSIFKPLVLAMALDQKTVTMDYVCELCNRPHVIGEYAINNWNSELNPNSSIKDIIKNSDNIGMSYIINTMDLSQFLSYFKKLHLDSKTNIDLAVESRALPKTYWAPIDFAAASFGQAFAITQIQMLSAFNTLANNGYYVEPKIAPPTNSPQTVFSENTIKNIKDVLKYATENGAVAKFKSNNIEVCGKSGTAQLAIKGSYTDSSSIASYIGFSPCANPRFSMIVTINNPRSSPWGSSTAAPIWFELADIINHLL